jgi:hypothetical protein
MADITLRSGDKVWSEGITHNTTIDNLLLGINGYTPYTLDVLKALGELGPSIIEVLPDLLELKLQQTHPEVLKLLEEVCVKVNSKKRKKADVEIIQVTGDLNADVYQKCNFCEKETLVQKDVEKLCPPGRFYCCFCLRHNYNHRDNRHILIFSMRGIVGYYFWQFYFSPPRPCMWLSEIKDYLLLHEEVGLRNPLFNYDPDTFTWFVDFRRVGDSKKKMPLKEVKCTVIEMLAVFNMHIHVKGLSMAAFYGKYSDAINDFYSKRYRPEGKRHLVPTFKGCGNPDWGYCNNGNQIVLPVCAGNKMSIEDTKSFSLSLIKEHLWNKTSSIT